MSRITRGPITDGQDITATDINDRYTDYSQSAALNGFNLRDAALDLPQLQKDWLCPYISETTIGDPSLDHSTVITVPSITTAPGTPHIVQDSGGTPSVVSFGLGGLEITATDIMRVYWSLSVNPTYSGTPWKSVGARGSYTFPSISSGAQLLGHSCSCWVMWLEWDVTDNTLANFVPVPGQASFDTNIVSTIYGSVLEDCGSTVAIPAWMVAARGTTDGKVSAGTITAAKTGWRGVSGAWHYSGAEDSGTTVYGLRWRITGVMSPYYSGAQNWLTIDENAGGAGMTLEYTGGTAQVIKHRLY